MLVICLDIWKDAEFYFEKRKVTYVYAKLVSIDFFFETGKNPMICCEN